MASASNPTDHIVRSDLDPEFIETALKRLAWNYHDLREKLANNIWLTNDQRGELFNKNMGVCATEALQFACDRHGVPFEHLKLECNGQIKLLVRMGRLIIMQETVEIIGDAPKAADFKEKLASTNSAVQQLELDLGDGFCRGPEWSGCILGVLLHGPVGPDFTEAHKKLGCASLGIPDAAYSFWTRRFDLYEIAMYGRKGTGWLLDEEPDEAPGEQRDEVNVYIRRKNANRENGQ